MENIKYITMLVMVAYHCITDGGASTVTHTQGHEDSLLHEADANAYLNTSINLMEYGSEVGESSRRLRAAARRTSKGKKKAPRVNVAYEATKKKQGRKASNRRTKATPKSKTSSKSPEKATVYTRYAANIQDPNHFYLSQTKFDGDFDDKEEVYLYFKTPLSKGDMKGLEERSKVKILGNTYKKVKDEELGNIANKSSRRSWIYDEKDKKFYRYVQGSKKSDKGGIKVKDADTTAEGSEESVQSESGETAESSAEENAALASPEAAEVKEVSKGAGGDDSSSSSGDSELESSTSPKSAAEKANDEDDAESKEPEEAASEDDSKKASPGTDESKTSAEEDTSGESKGNGSVENVKTEEKKTNSKEKSLKTNENAETDVVSEGASESGEPGASDSETAAAGVPATESGSTDNKASESGSESKKSKKRKSSKKGKKGSKKCAKGDDNCEDGDELEGIYELFDEEGNPVDRSQYKGKIDDEISSEVSSSGGNVKLTGVKVLDEDGNIVTETASKDSDSSKATKKQKRSGQTWSNKKVVSEITKVKKRVDKLDKRMDSAETRLDTITRL